jgi:hypothetical protein
MHCLFEWIPAFAGMTTNVLKLIRLYMHYRQGKIKREHSIIKDVFELLQKVEKLEMITTIVPGRIKPIRGNYPTAILELKTKSSNGFKCIAKSSRSVQEVFIVTEESNIEKVIAELKKMGLIVGEV